MLEQPSFAVMVADTVGAGDACLGGFIASMLTAGEAGLETHLRFAAATAAVVCSRSGAHAPGRREVLAIQIGRASCRGRGLQFGLISGVAVSLKKKQKIR